MVAVAGSNVTGSAARPVADGCLVAVIDIRGKGTQSTPINRYTPGSSSTQAFTEKNYPWNPHKSLQCMFCATLA